MFKKLLSFVLALALSVSLISCSDGDGAFSYCEMSIPLTEDFYPVESEKFDATYSNGNYAVAILRISFVAAVMDGIPETLSAHDFGEIWLERCDRDANMISGDLAYCEYYEDAGGIEYFYLEAFYRSPYAYFVVLFTTAAELESTGRVDFLKFAKNVTFTT